MQSHPVKRVVSGALAATAVIAAVSFSQSSATAAPNPAPQNPPTSSEELTKYRELAGQAEKINEDLLKAKDDLAARQGELDVANGDLEKSKQAQGQATENEERFRLDVDRFADASFTSGAQLNKMSALLTGTSAQDFLDRSSALGVLANDQNKALSNLTDATAQTTAAQQQAADAQGRAQTAKDDAAKLTSDIESRKSALDSQMKELEEASGSLSDEDRAEQGDEGEEPPTDIKAPGDAAQTAVNAALGKRGSPYVWGATGPGQFDCSGLTSWAYKQAGISLPRSSRAQATFGQSVPRDQLQPGDLVFFYSPVSHVGIYIGNGQMVHAPTSGDVVKVSALQKEFSGARRPG
ncbi:hydrolase Nlp/P60 [Amycolatopsis antarctica]|uniref:Hydrolase Nlp/P60 n=1 Tax=Amycolatopsis antarctica TaxID=1854586 RepID=A0A263CZJ2_9PSEU|nr:C40 family peptidase [Amycolatopsis antarctica]OZM70525.1 hydrolase Nlp/P60 [Amycolatopsis antarctica]